MKRTALALCLFLVLLAPIMLLAQSNLVLPITEASIPKPSVPEFTVKLVNNWYDVPTTYSTDPYTGETITHPGYRVDNKTVELSIKNQPFAYSFNGSTYHLCYNVRTKPHFVEDWDELYPVTDRYTSGGINYERAKYVSGPIQSSSAYTVLSFPDDYPANARVDFQVQAIVGHDAQVYVNDHPLAPYPIGHYEQGIAFDTAGDWSNTQTITIPTSTPSPTSSPSPTSTQTRHQNLHRKEPHKHYR